MSKESISGQIKFDGWNSFTREAFHKPSIRKAMRRAGAVAQKEAKRLVSRGTRSEAGEYPGLRSGQLRRAIRVKVSPSGFLVRVMPQRLAGMDHYYPAYLFYGTSRGVKARENYMTDALATTNAEVRRVISDGLLEALR